MRTCIFCKTRYEMGSGITFHKFPTGPRLKHWLKNLNCDKWTPRPNDYLCSKHFTDECFIRYNSRTTLKKCSIPTIFHETNEPLALVKTEMSNDVYDHSQDVKIKEEVLEHSVSIKTESPDYNSQFNEYSPEGMLLRSFEAIHNTLPEFCTDIVKTDPLSLEGASTTDTDVINPLLNGSSTEQTDKINMNVPSTNHDTRQCETPKSPRTRAELCSIVRLDHSYENPQKTSDRVLQRVQKALKASQARAKLLSRHVKRLKRKVSTLTTVIVDLKKPKRFCNNCKFYKRLKSKGHNNTRP